MRVETGGWGGRGKKNVDVRCIRILYASNMETVCENSEGGNGNTEVCENEKLPREVRVVQRMSPVLILSSELGPTGMWTSKIWPVRQEDRRGSRRLSAGSSRCAVGACRIRRSGTLKKGCQFHRVPDRKLAFDTYERFPSLGRPARAL
jgi:hypothetical protein